MGKIQAVNIKWDVDNKEDLKGLPTEIDIPPEIAEESDDEYEEAISDYISDVTGFCHRGFEIRKVDSMTVIKNS